MASTIKLIHISTKISKFASSIKQIPTVAMATAARNMKSIFQPPNCILSEDGCTFSRDMFTKAIQLPALHIDKKLSGACLKALKTKTVPRKQFLALRNSLLNPDEKILLLNPEIVSSDDLKSLGEAGVVFVQANNLQDRFQDFQLELCYSDWTSDEILRSLLPGDVEVPTGFSRIGHIAHLNLRPEHLKYKHIIGEVLMDKNPGLKTIVNKTAEINTEFRLFSMELLAGENNMIATTKEHGTIFEFDFSKIYWNPRLSNEHTRIVGLLTKGDVVYDMFAGVGPFAIPAAKKGCVALANDLNPESHKWLDHNIKLNKIKPGSVRTYNLDGRDFVRKIFCKDLIERAQDGNPHADDHPRTHVVMNLPSLAIEFLDVFPGLLRDVPVVLQDDIELPMVHCHCFSKETDPVADVRKRIENVLNHTIKGALIHDVRDVAPNKEMMCVSFKIPAAVVFRDKTKDQEEEIRQPECKKLKMEYTNTLSAEQGDL